MTKTNLNTTLTTVAKNTAPTTSETPTTVAAKTTVKTPVNVAKLVKLGTSLEGVNVVMQSAAAELFNMVRKAVTIKKFENRTIVGTHEINPSIATVIEGVTNNPCMFKYIRKAMISFLSSRLSLPITPEGKFDGDIDVAKLKKAQKFLAKRTEKDTITPIKEGDPRVEKKEKYVFPAVLSEEFKPTTARKSTKKVVDTAAALDKAVEAVKDSGNEEDSSVLEYVKNNLNVIRVLKGSNISLELLEYVADHVEELTIKMKAAK